MTIDIHTRPSERGAPEDDGRRQRRGLKSGPQITLGRSSRPAGKVQLVVGAQPRANLLPPEIILKRKQLKTRRALRGGVVLVALVTVAGCVATFGITTAAQVQLAASQAEQRALVLEQAEYADVSELLRTIDTIRAGQRVGSSTEINLRDFIGAIALTLPKGVTLQTVKIDTGTPMSAFPQSEAPLQGVRVGSISFTATSKTLPDIPEWLRSLDAIPGFVDATPGSVKQENGIYTAEVLMHIDDGAFSLRYDPEHMAEVAAAEAAAEASDGTVKSFTAEAPDDSAADEGTDAAGDAAADEEGN
jgi:Tfp pilus assembly protein PilN